MADKEDGSITARLDEIVSGEVVVQMTIDAPELLRLSESGDEFSLGEEVFVNPDAYFKGEGQECRLWACRGRTALCCPRGRKFHGDGVSCSRFGSNNARHSVCLQVFI